MNTNTLLPDLAQIAQGRRRRLVSGLAALLLLLTGPAAFAQLAGTYTINKNLPTAGTNFASFTDAATALNTSGISASVRINVLNGPYNEQFALNAVTGVSATDTIVVDGGSSKQTLSYTATSAQPAAVLLNGTDYVTLNNLTIDVSGGATYGIGVHLVAQANNNRVSNSVVMASGTATSSTANAAIAASGTLTSATSVGDANNLRIENNVLSGGYFGVILTGASTTNRAVGTRITNNEIRDFYLYGLDVENSSGARLTGNNIHRTTRTVSLSTFYGVYLTGDVSTAVERNRIHDPFTGSTASTAAAYGLYYTTNDATAGNENDAVNNLIYNFNGSGTEYGIYNSGSDYARYYYNTISLDNQAATGATQNTYGFYQTTQAIGIDFRNNIVSVTRTGGTGLKYALDFITGTSAITSNYNDLYVGTGATYFTGRFSSIDYVTLANWRTANSGVYDQNSVQANPQFVAATTGNLRPTAAAPNGAATPLTRVPADFTTALRSTTAPDLGAFEFTPPAADVALVSIDAPTAPVTAGARTVTVTIRNNGVDPLTSVRLEYVLNGAAAVGQTFTLATPLASGATTALSFTTQGTLVVGANALAVTASLPNGQTDSNPGNNSQSVTLYTAIAGTFTINKNLPTGGTNFTSFTDAALALNAGITGSVRINVLNGPYNEQFALNAVTGVSATDTIVVDGGSSKQTLSYTATSAQPAAVLLNGTDYVTLNNLTIDVSGGTTYGIGVHLVAQANNNRVSNSVVMASGTATSSTANAGIAASGTLTSASSAGNANNLRIENNTISGGYYGVIVTGASTTARNTGLRITNNEIRDFYTYGLDVESHAGARLLANNVHRTTRSDVSSYYGAYLVGVVGTAVERNRLHDSFTGNTADTGTSYGIYLTSSDGTTGTENDVVNNLVYNFNGAGTEYGFYNASSDYARYYHNTVSLDNQAAVGTTQTTYGFYQTTLATGIDFRNNIVSVTRTGGTGIKYALYFVTTTSTIVSNYNDLYVGTGTLYSTGRFGTVGYATLADWRTANSAAYDQNSVQANPQFTAASAGNLQPTAVALDGAGTTLARVPRDFTNALRSSPPDPGAYEFAPMANDVAVLSIDAPTSPALPTSNPVTVTIRNGGMSVLASVTLSYALNGGTPVSQTFTGLSVAPNATRQLTFTTGVVAPSGTNTLTVTGSLPNGQPDGNAANNTQTITFTQPTPANDEPCTALALSASPLAASNSGASTSIQTGINTPSCVGGPLPKDVWFTFVPSGTSTTITLAGAAAGGLRVFTSASCSAGPFNEVFCAGGGAGTTQTIAVPNLVAGTRYYVAVSGYNSADATGSFTIAATALLGTRAQTNSTALAVFPNPSATGSLTLQLARPLGLGTVELLNALGQVVQRQPLAAAPAQTLPTTGLAAGLYTLRVQAGGEVLTRKVVLQ
ncbi:beta strand repeat-containing protein [Hymenobacter negativus]|uniref:T9SS type A sorting domain-containing protein n=1 Tax=Hymenobacter negativus TaxID=2795026 RepID=A0ABS0Q9C5_9BACT|nr:NosD domain-containing protein [Hymenobacter negativus]MBH8559282.1 T9SS type A sorting domain-containing protein [Hymenobacter negativus]